MKKNIMIKNKETKKIEKLSPEEYRNITNKVPLTIENLKKHNNTIKNGISIFIGIFILGIISMLILFFYDINFNDLVKEHMLEILIFGIILLILLVTLIFVTKKTNKIKKYINQGNFKIVEDKIYDKYFEMDYSQDNGTTYNYYICTKIYGYQKIDSIIYEVCKNNDSIYYLMCNGNEKNNEVIGNKQKEIKRNNKNTYQEYLAVINPLSDELKKYFVPYDEIIGESNYKKRMEYRINELKEKRHKVICKNCNEKFNLKNGDVCTKCGEKYNFDITDVIEYKDWL